MPSRGSYQIASREEGKAAERDQSYRSCILALLVFLFLCIVLILACLPWKRGFSFADEEEDQAGKDKQYSGDYTTTARTTTTTVETTEVFLTVKDGNDLEHYHENATEAPENTTTVSDDHREILSATTANDSELVTSTTGNSTVVLFARLQLDEETTESVTTDSEEHIQLQNVETTQATTIDEDFVSRIVGILSGQAYDENDTEWTSTTETDFSSSTDSEKTTPLSILNDDNNSTEESSTIEQTTTEEIVHEILNTTYYTPTTGESSDTHSFSTTLSAVTTEDLTTTTETSGTTVHNVTGTSTEVDKLTSFTATTTTMEPEEYEENEECMSGQCKQTAARLLSRMNHSADPCDDFYEYACGGMEADPQMVDLNLADQAYKRIEEQMLKEKDENKSSVFRTYYNSCMDYEKSISLEERIELVKSELEKIGKFYTVDSWPTNYPGITELLAKMLLHNSPLLFDVVADIDEFHSGDLALRIEPASFKSSPFIVDNADDACLASDTELNAHHVTLETLYKNYKSCKNDTQDFINSISVALNALGMFTNLNTTYNISQYVSGTVINIDLEIIQGYFANYPPESEMRKAYLTKDYANIEFGQLEDQCQLVNWTQLILLLTGFHVEPQGLIQVYFHDSLIRGLQNLEKFSQRSMMQMHNALLGLYTRNLYEDMVVTRARDPNSYCLRVATKLLVPEAARLYISSYSNEELGQIRTTTSTLFQDLKETLSMKLNSADWLSDSDRQNLLKKIRDLKLVLPTDRRLYQYWETNVTESDLSGNFFENSMILTQKFRTRMYSGLSLDFHNPKYIWMYYTTPYHSRATAIYGLNLIVVPIGSIDWSSLTKQDSATYLYLALATLGNIIARQIAHHFDANGVYYWNGTRNIDYSLLNNGSASMIFEDYINCHRNVLDDREMNMIVPSTGQLVTFKVSQLTLNEHLSDVMGLRLAYDTLARRASTAESALPWLRLNINQLFYIAYAQMHCTKKPLAASYVSLHEDEFMPSRIRLYATAINDRLLGEAWDCPMGSVILPGDSCKVFPYLDFRENELSPA